MAQIMETNNYGKFILSQFNRNVRKTWHLEESMSRHGFIDEYPLHVIKKANGQLEIKAGHHRFYVARKLGLSVKYVICRDEATIHELEHTTVPWTLADYLESYVRLGLKAYIEVREYSRRTGISLNQSISMLAGQSAGSGNWTKQFKDGAFRLGDTSHADIVGDIITHCRECGFPYATFYPFVAAVSKIVWVDNFQPEHLKKKISTHIGLMKRQGDREGYITMLETIYNRGSKERVPLAFKAEEAARKRAAATPKSRTK